MGRLCCPSRITAPAAVEIVGVRPLSPWYASISQGSSSPSPRLLLEGPVLLPAPMPEGNSELEKGNKNHKVKLGGKVAREATLAGNTLCGGNESAAPTRPPSAPCSWGAWGGGAMRENPGDSLCRCPDALSSQPGRQRWLRGVMRV